MSKLEAREKTTCYIQGTPFPHKIETFQTRREWHNIFKGLEEKNLPNKSTQQSCPSQLKERSFTRQAKAKGVDHPLDWLYKKC